MRENGNISNNVIRNIRSGYSKKDDAERNYRNQISIRTYELITRYARITSEVVRAKIREEILSVNAGLIKKWARAYHAMNKEFFDLSDVEIAFQIAVLDALNICAKDKVDVLAKSELVPYFWAIVKNEARKSLVIETGRNVYTVRSLHRNGMNANYIGLTKESDSEESEEPNSIFDIVSLGTQTGHADLFNVSPEKLFFDTLEWDEVLQHFHDFLRVAPIKYSLALYCTKDQFVTSVGESASSYYRYQKLGAQLLYYYFRVLGYDFEELYKVAFADDQKSVDITTDECMSKCKEFLPDITAAELERH